MDQLSSPASAGIVAVVFRGQADARPGPRLEPVLAALAGIGLAADPVPYADERADEARTRLLAADGVLAWVDPVTDDGDRTILDAILREAAAAGTWIGSHPNVIALMGTKEVLYTTRELGWGTDTHLYATPEQFRRQFPARLAADGIRVLKPTRGNGGRGVWKVTLGDGRGGSPVPDPQAIVRAQHAQIRDSSFEDIQLGELMARCEIAFAAYGGSGKLIDQAFSRRIGHGIIRSYLVTDQVAGFGRQYPGGMSPADLAAGAPHPDSPEAAAAVMGLPSGKVMHAAGDPAFARLRALLEQQWVPGMRAILGLDREALPALWDADFLLGPPDADGHDTYILCEINASSVTPSPAEVVLPLAAATLKAVTRARARARASRQLATLRLILCRGEPDFHRHLGLFVKSSMNWKNSRPLVIHRFRPINFCYIFTSEAFLACAKNHLPPFHPRIAPFWVTPAA